MTRAVADPEFRLGEGERLASHAVCDHIFAALAEFERELIRERTIAGLTAARAREGSRKNGIVA